MKCNKELIEFILEKAEEIYEKYSYSIRGKPETYDDYNQGWQDCADEFIHFLSKLKQNEEAGI